MLKRRLAIIFEFFKRYFSPQELTNVVSKVTETLSKSNRLEYIPKAWKVMKKKIATVNGYS